MLRLPSLLIPILAAVVSVSCQQQQAQTKMAPPVVPVSIAKAEAQSVPTELYEAARQEGIIQNQQLRREDGGLG